MVGERHVRTGCPGVGTRGCVGPEVVVGSEPLGMEKVLYDPTRWGTGNVHEKGERSTVSNRGSIKRPDNQ